jgi:hypothetical protein
LFPEQCLELRDTPISVTLSGFDSSLSAPEFARDGAVYIKVIQQMQNNAMGVPALIWNSTLIWSLSSRSVVFQTLAGQGLAARRHGFELINFYCEPALIIWSIFYQKVLGIIFIIEFSDIKEFHCFIIEHEHQVISIL